MVEEKFIVLMVYFETHWELGVLHRFHDPAIEYPNGDKEWWFNGKRHRPHGPAVIFGNKQYWFFHGEFVKQFVKEIVT
ncbi:MAG: hypothetical protein WCG45_01955 [bacterium]